MPAYLTSDQAEARLDERFAISATVLEGDLLAASEELDAMGPFVGSRADAGQARAFPRVLPPLNGEAETPDGVLDAVALIALSLSEDEEPAIRSYSILDESTTYAEPRESRNAKRIRAAVSPYLLKTGSAAGGRRYAERETFEGS